MSSKYAITEKFTCACWNSSSKGSPMVATVTSCRFVTTLIIASITIVCSFSTNRVSHVGTNGLSVKCNTTIDRGGKEVSTSSYNKTFLDYIKKFSIIKNT